jgi:hypothetical protein
MKLAPLILLAILIAGCSRTPDSSDARSAPQGAQRPAAALKKIGEEQALSLLLSTLKAHKVADLDCLAFQNESEQADDAKAEVWEFAAREKHDEKCGGDPAVSHVRDRYRVNSDGVVWRYDAAEADYARL